ncbi:hypothetical protein CN918_31990 [Priestia megaterium]|nr:hypothetical protein CN918_31990 [Priestia megaterium]
MSVYNIRAKECDFVFSKSILLSSLNLEDLYITHLLPKYKIEFDRDATVADNIYKYLSSRQGFIQHKRHVTVPKDRLNSYQRTFRELVLKGAPIVLFFSSFSPKITNPSITNQQLLPDMGDLLTLIHLHLVAKEVRSFYDYGFRFIIGYKGYLYQPIMRWSNSTVDQTFDILQELIKHAERITGVRNVIELVNIVDLINLEGEYFQHQWKIETRKVKNLYLDDDEYMERKISGWLRDFKQSVNRNDFAQIDNFHHYMLEQAFSIRALREVQFRGGEKDSGICNSLPPSVQASVRGLDPELSIQLNPYFRYHAHQRLLGLNQSTGHWETFKWSEKAKNAQPILTGEYNYPFYFHI